MAFNRNERSDNPRRRTMHRRKKVCVFCGKDNNWKLCKASESSYSSDQESAPCGIDAIRAGLRKTDHHMDIRVVVFA